MKAELSTLRFKETGFSEKEETKHNFRSFNSPQSSTMFQFRSGSKNKKTIRKDEQKYKSGSEIDILSISKQLKPSKTTKESISVLLPSKIGTNRIESKNILYHGSKHFNSGHIYIDSESSRIQKENILSIESKQELSYRDPKYRKSQNSLEKKTSPKASEGLKKMISHLQFNSRSSKFDSVISQEHIDLKLEKTTSSIEFNPKFTDFHQQLQQLKQQAQTLRSESIGVHMALLKQQEQHNQTKQQHTIQINNLQNQILQLNTHLNLKYQQTEHVSNILLDEISQLIKDRYSLQTKLNNITPIETQSQSILKQLEQKLNHKDSIIVELQNNNIRLQSQIGALTFEKENMKCRTQLVPVYYPEETTMCEETFKHYEKQLYDCRQFIKFKEEQIIELKKVLLERTEQVQRVHNQLLIQQLRRATEVESLKAEKKKQRVSNGLTIQQPKQYILGNQQILSPSSQTITKYPYFKVEVIQN